MPNQRAGFFYAFVFLFASLAAQAQTSSGPVTIVGGAGPMFFPGTQTVAGTTPSQFAVSSSGAATYRIPIQVPPGVAGMQPKLELVYNSQGGNGLAGVGWGIAGLSAIYRCPKTLASDGARGDAVNLDLNDRYCLDGQKLILVSGTYGAAASEYRTELESFSKITAVGAAVNGPASFIVKTKAGLTIEYGNTADSRIEAPGKTMVRAWAQNKVSDIKGNYLTVSYTEDNPNGDYYPSRIDYTGTASTSPTASVRFAYESRTDVTALPIPVSGGKNGVRLKQIDIYPNATMSRQYLLNYSYGTTSGRSRLNSVTECSSQGECLSPISIQAEANTPVVKNITWSGGHGLSNAGWQMADLFGDGRQVYYTHTTTGQHYATRFNADGTLQNWSWSGGHGVSDAGWQMADLFGDGRQVYYTHTTTGQHYATRLNADGTLQNWSWSGGHGVGDLGWKMADLFGDGRQEYYTHNSSGQHFATRLNADNTVQNWTWSGGFGIGDAGWQLVDLFGDGRPVYYTHNTSGQHYATRLNADGTLQNWYWPGGHGVSDAGWQMADLFGDGRQVYYTHTAAGQHYATRLNADSTLQNWFWSGGSIVGDGGWQMVDLFGDGRQVYYTFNSAGQHFATRLNADNTVQNWTWSGGGKLGDASWQMADLFGDGRKVFYTPTTAGNHYATQIVNAVPDSVVSIGTGTGASTLITQKPLTDNTVYTKDTTGVLPLTDKQIAAYVVSRVASSDGLGGMSASDYTYGGLKAELGTGRGMLGFQWIKSREAATGIENYTEYHQDFPFTGMPIKNEIWFSIPEASSSLLKRTTLKAECKIPRTGVLCVVESGNRYFTHITSKIDQSWDLNGAAFPSEVTNTAYNINTPDTELRGDPTQIVVSTVHGGSVSTRSTSNMYYAANTTDWILCRLKTSTVTSSGTTALPVGSTGEITMLGATVTPASALIQLNAPGTGSTSVSVVASGGIGPYTYSWSRIAGSRTLITNGNTANPTFSAVLNSGESFTETMRVTLKDAVGGTTYQDVSVRYSVAFVFSQVISVNTSDYNLRAAAVSAGWNSDTKLFATVTINAGIMVSASSVANAAFDTGSGFPAGSTLTLVNKGAIYGMGGAGGAPGFWYIPPTAGQIGGPALRAQMAMTVTNSGSIGGGGNGGAGGASYTTPTSHADIQRSGGGGGGGRTGATNSAGGSGGGAPGTTAGGGAGGTTFYQEYNGQPGGDYGGGPAVIGNANITWLATGTRIGALN